MEKESPREDVIETEVDSSIAIKEEIVEEEVVKEPIAEEPRFSIQAGIFFELSEARRAQRRIINKLGLPAILVEEFDYTRVIIPGFYKREDTYKYYPELAGLGYDNIQVIEKRK